MDCSSILNEQALPTLGEIGGNRPKTLPGGMAKVKTTSQ